MTALANSLRRIWSAKNRVPRLTGWGKSGPRFVVYEFLSEEAPLVRWAQERLQGLVAVAHQTAPTVILVTLNLFR
jgi:hypothetical protein